jgi:hypothetical protein
MLLVVAIVPRLIGTIPSQANNAHEDSRRNTTQVTIPAKRWHSRRRRLPASSCRKTSDRRLGTRSDFPACLRKTESQKAVGGAGAAFKRSPRPVSTTCTECSLAKLAC